jgi:hypothetical protein
MTTIAEIKEGLAAGVDDAERAVDLVEALISHLDQAIARLQVAASGTGQFSVLQAIISLHEAREQFTTGRVLIGTAIRDTGSFAAVL